MLWRSVNGAPVAVGVVSGVAMLVASAVAEGSVAGVFVAAVVAVAVGSAVASGSTCPEACPPGTAGAQAGPATNSIAAAVITTASKPSCRAVLRFGVIIILPLWAALSARPLATSQITGAPWRVWQYLQGQEPGLLPR